MPLAVSALLTYPLKSGAPISHSEAQVTARGLAGDRRWMAVTPDGHFLTGRKHPVLTQIQATPTAEGLQLQAPGGTPISVAAPGRAGAALPVTVWDDVVTGHLADPAASAWLSEVLGVDCRLVFMADETQRPVDRAYAPAGDVVSFADGFPLLLTTDGSLADLNQRLAVPVEMGRFRPNLVVSGASAFEEDGWSAVRVGSAVLGVVKPCARCVFTTVDARTGRPDPSREPLRTLATYRKAAGGVMFGQNLTVRQPGRIAVGDPVTVIRA